MEDDENHVDPIKDCLISLLSITVQHQVPEVATTEILKLLKSGKFSWIPEQERQQIPKSYAGLVSFLQLGLRKEEEARTYTCCTNLCRTFDQKQSIPDVCPDCKCSIFRSTSANDEGALEEKGREEETEENQNEQEESKIDPERKANKKKKKKRIPKALFAHYPLVPKIQDFWKNKDIATLIHHGHVETMKRVHQTMNTEEKAYMIDVYDGKLWEDIAVPFLTQHEYGLVVNMTNDSVNLDRGQRLPGTPYLYKIHNFDPRFRRLFMLLVGLFHRKKELKQEKKERSKAKKKNNHQYRQADVDILVQELLQCYYDGFDIEDHSVDPPRQAKCHVLLLFTSSDLRALPHLNQQASVPAYLGACTLCYIIGNRMGPNTSYY